MKKNKNYTRFYDTSALLNGNYPEEHDWISSTVLRELENIKTSGERKGEEVKKSARKVARFLLNNTPNIFSITDKEWKKIKLKFSFTDAGDNRILAELIALKSEYPNLELQTSDICLHLLAKKFDIKSHFCAANEEKGGLYTGYIEEEFTDEELNNIYANETYNPRNLLTNQYLVLYSASNKSVVDIRRWDGLKLAPIQCKDVNNKYMDKVQPKDIYQKMALDLLERNDVPVKLLQGAAGTGKDYLSTAVALDKVFRHQHEKIYFIRNLIDLKDAPQVGYLAGDLSEKISWGLGPLMDILGGEEGLNWIEEQGAIEQLNLGFIRGRSLQGIIYCTELQNTTESAVQSIISRAAEGTELFLNSDLKQIDKKIFQEQNGVVSLQQNLKGHHLFGTIYLPNTHRSEVAELAGLLTSN